VSLLDGVPAGLRALREAGYRLVVITNQGGVARGTFTERDVDAVHRRIVEQIEQAGDGRSLIERFYYCPFHPEGTVAEYRREHPWRKPGAGMLFQAAVDLDLDLARSWVIGDQPRDVIAGQAAGCRTVLIGGSEPEADLRPTAIASSFPDAVQQVLRHTPPRDAAAGEQAARSATAGGETGTQLATAVAEAKPLAKVPRAPAVARDDGGSDTASTALQRAVRDLTDELRSQRLRETEFTALRMTALITQLLVLLLALLGLLQLEDWEVFLRWMVCAVLLQLFTLTLLVADTRG
ncbi:MAG: D-glycero-alpha-D-manno-heptose-1,7-bisphosphate 7-phosphatase, partial [Planctomycetota bacterium]|jgi:histidinol-phosphate phosphatase family protein